VRYSPEEK